LIVGEGGDSSFIGGGDPTTGGDADSTEGLGIADPPVALVDDGGTQKGPGTVEDLDELQGTGESGDSFAGVGQRSRSNGGSYGGGDEDTCGFGI
jgi:hypothetical protein